MANPNILLSGRVGTDVESRTMTDGTMKVKFRVITSDRKKNDRGEWEDKDTSGWTVVAWDKLAEKVAKSLSKGQLVTVQGQMKEVSWMDQEGNKKKSIETRASEISININGIRVDEPVFAERDDEVKW
jgi:single-strand DNA-binding protein